MPIVTRPEFCVYLFRKLVGMIWHCTLTRALLVFALDIYGIAVGRCPLFLAKRKRLGRRPRNGTLDGQSHVTACNPPGIETHRQSNNPFNADDTDYAFQALRVEHGKTKRNMLLGHFLARKGPAQERACTIV